MSDRIPLPRPGQGADKARMDEILRVDHAGEYAAVLIYRAQRAVFEARKGREAITHDLAEMQDQEAVHLARFERLLNERKVRPTAMTPVWRLAASALGAGTALIGEKAAHACTEAVEDVIEKHYAEQIAEIQDRDSALAAELTRFREDELAHTVFGLSTGELADLARAAVEHSFAPEETRRRVLAEIDEVTGSGGAG